MRRSVQADQTPTVSPETLTDCREQNNEASEVIDEIGCVCTTVYRMNLICHVR